MRYSYAVQFEEALKAGNLSDARSLLDELASGPEPEDLWLPECYADLALAFDRDGRRDDAIASMECAIKHGWGGRPDPRSDIAEFHLRAGRGDEAAAIWSELREQEPGDVWLYNAAGLSYSEVGEHDLAVQWLGEGIEVAIQDNDPEGIIPQLSHVRRGSLAALGRDLDALEHRADEFVERWRRSRAERKSRLEDSRGPDQWAAQADAGEATPTVGAEVMVAMAWFPAGEYEKAIARWESLADDWAGVGHADYCRRMDGHIKWLRAQGVRARAVSPIVVDEFVSWCQDRGEDPEQARAHYAAERLRLGEAVPWPPGRNEPCWCGSTRKYKKCCGVAEPAPMHGGEA